jgi:hypothetical protein
MIRVRIRVRIRAWARIGLGPGFLYWFGKKPSSQWIQVRKTCIRRRVIYAGLPGTRIAHYAGRRRWYYNGRRIRAVNLSHREYTLMDDINQRLQCPMHADVNQKMPDDHQCHKTGCQIIRRTCILMVSNVYLLNAF